MIPTNHGHMLVLKKVYRLVSEDLKDEIVEWVCKYDNVIHSTITDEKILVEDELIGKKTKRVGKLLLSCSVREVHNDLITDVNDDFLKDVWNENNLLVSETGLRCFLPDQLKKFPPLYNQMCGCECCIIIKKLQLTLNSWRKRQIKFTCTRSSNEYFSIFSP